MAETLGAVASVLTVLKLAGAATKYIKDVKQGSSDRLRLRDELRSTTCLLEMIKDRIEDSEDAAGSDAESNAEGDAVTLKPSSIASLAGDDSPLALFQQILEDIISKLAPQDRLRRLTQPFKWPFDKKDIAELVSTLDRLKTHFTLIMQNDLVYGPHCLFLMSLGADAAAASLRNFLTLSSTTSAKLWKTRDPDLWTMKPKRSSSGSARLPTAPGISTSLKARRPAPGHGSLTIPLSKDGSTAKSTCCGAQESVRTLDNSMKALRKLISPLSRSWQDHLSVSNPVPGTHLPLVTVGSTMTLTAP
jgi:hypothetical protein